MAGVLGNLSAEVAEPKEADILDAAALLNRTGLSAGMVAADMGVGREGSFLLNSARMVGPVGKVYALDVVKEVLSIVKQMCEGANVDNVVSVWTDLEIYGAAKAVPDNSVDVGILANTIYQSENKEAMMLECTRMVKPGGKMLVVEWKPVATPFGPPVESRVNPVELQCMAQRAGLKLVEEFDAGEYHWGQIYTK